MESAAQPRNEWTTDIEDRIVENIACGMSVAEACGEEHFTDRSFYRRLLKNEDLRRKYAHAREARADAHAESMEEIKRKVMAGEIDAMTARVLMDATKWQAAHEKPKVYGDKLDVTGIPAGQSVNILLPIRERLARLKRAGGETVESVDRPAALADSAQSGDPAT